ncbi:thymidine phosphorylase [Candidatus Pacearchaeota archaeon]|nr:thymidine phosphorylase [Candidatus Pacearchaeota archaeon]
MKLKIKNLHWSAGRPVAILNDKTAKKLNVFANDRVAITNSKTVYAIVDIFPKLIKEDQIGLSEELTKIIKLKNKSSVKVSTSELSKATFLIKKKMQGKQLTEEELIYIISEIVHNNLTEAEIAYFTAAEKLNGMSMKETVNLTKAMIKTGTRLKFKGKYIADKHCIGGIAGNRTTPIVVAICASAGLILPKTSSRAITSASGTAGVIETISKVELSLKDLKSTVKKTGACLAWGGSLGLAPSDDKIIRVERLLNLDVEPQLLASIISKKVSAGSKYIIIDIPYGKGAKIATLEKAKNLGVKFKKISNSFKLNLKVVCTKGSEPIGNGFGPTLEMLDILSVLKNSPNSPDDLREKSLFLSSELMKLCKIKNARKKAEEILSSGKAYEKFKEIINTQNGKKDFDKRVESLKLAKYKKIVNAKHSGRITEISNEGINSLCRILGTPETISSGAYLHKHIGEIKKSEPILTLYTESKTKMKDAIKFLEEFKPIKIK